MVSYIGSDLQFILDQIKISEEHSLYVTSGGAQGENVVTGSGADTITASSAVNVIDGGAEMIPSASSLKRMRTGIRSSASRRETRSTLAASTPITVRAVTSHLHWSQLRH